MDAEAPRVEAADPRFAEVLGRPPAALAGLVVSELELGHPFLDSPTDWRRHVDQVESCQPLSWPTWLRVAGGRVVRALLSLTVEQVEGERCLVADLRTVASGPHPVGERAHADLDAIPMAACRLAVDGRVLSHNASATRFLDFGIDEAQRAYACSLPSDVVSRDGDPVVARELPWVKALAGQACLEPVTLGFERPGRDTRWALVCAAPDAGSDPADRSAVVTLVDVTSDKCVTDALVESDRELRRTLSSVNSLQDQLARSEHMASLGLMAAGVAHEINNPLSYILSNLSFAAERAIDQETRLALREALEGAGRMRDIVRDLKTLSRMDSDDDAGPVDVRNAVDAALKLTLDEVRQRARLQRHFEAVPHVLGDETRLVQVMLNLVTNAAHSIDSGAPGDNQITVEVRRASDIEVCIAVRDTGAGISRKHLSKVFEPFFTTKPAGQGTGLGLSLCHRLIDGMGGRIEVESEEGKGTCFTVYLMAADEGEAAPAPSPPTPSSRRLRLLVVDDELLVARAVQRMFKTEYVVDIALGGQQALDKLSLETFDIVLCDVMMPEISGLDVYRKIRAINPVLAQRFVFATGGLFSQDLSNSVKRLSNVIVEKPFEPEELRRVIEAAAQPGRVPSVAPGLAPPRPASAAPDEERN